MVTPPEPRKGDPLARWMLVVVLSALMSGAVVLGVVALDPDSQGIADDIVRHIPKTQTDVFVPRAPGPTAFPLDVEGAVNIFVERQEPATWPFAIALEADGKVVQEVGPTTAQYPTIDVVYIVQDSG